MMTETTRKAIISSVMILLLATCLGLLWFGEMYECKQFAARQDLTSKLSFTCKVLYKDKWLSRTDWYKSQRVEAAAAQAKRAETVRKEEIQYQLSRLFWHFKNAYDDYKGASDDFKADPLPTNGVKL